MRLDRLNSRPPVARRLVPLTILACCGLAPACRGAGPVAGSPRRPDAAAGRALFLRNWPAREPGSSGGDGLGPVYNARSCVACHGLATPGGAGPTETNVELVTLARRGGKPDPKPEERSALAAIHPGFAEATSVVVHRFGVDPEYAAWRRTFLDSAKGRWTDLPAPAADTKVSLTRSQRNAPAVLGDGLIDGVPDEVIEEAATRRFPAFPEVRGRVGRTRTGRVSRFGWKAQLPDLNEFVLTACANELGLEVPGHHQAADPRHPDRPARDLDLDADDCADLVAYVRDLPAPVATRPTPRDLSPALQLGREAFARIGCATCHAPRLGDVEGIYSDLLLHDMGAALSDGGTYYGSPVPSSTGPLAAASATEWRTPPLWGLRDTGPYLHDGRALSIEQAIHLHGGEGAGAAARFDRLGRAEKTFLMRFLRTLAIPAAESVAARAER